ncbi:GFA family protein [Acetobacteraceae bacterium KSS8]|uniref:GFA family protein n=1 Tax=Endosaccharibacter trunci TaxID=2812733 RepID=A0ABT1W2W5_9PROT|nr:GFA family protein [Acetobacteraceae bacterium KSS8]
MKSGTVLRHGRCHCGAVCFDAILDAGFAGLRRCNCSFCRMRGAVVAPAELRITQGGDVLSCYRFNTMAAEHFFCARCGIHTHLRRRSDPHGFAVNVACLDGCSPFDFAEVPVMDGINHPDDVGGPARIAGRLRYDPAR